VKGGKLTTDEGGEYSREREGRSKEGEENNRSLVALNQNNNVEDALLTVC